MKGNSSAEKMPDLSDDELVSPYKTARNTQCQTKCLNMASKRGKDRNDIQILGEKQEVFLFVKTYTTADEPPQGSVTLTRDPTMYQNSDDM